MGDRIFLLLIGALGFWVPVVLLEILSRGRYSIAIANLLPVACATGALWLLCRARVGRVRTLPLYMLAGIYLLCPLAITIAGSAFGGGFAAFAGGHDVWWLLLSSILPPLAMILAGYNGTIFGLLAITIILIAAAVWRNRSSPASRPA